MNLEIFLNSLDSEDLIDVYEKACTMAMISVIGAEANVKVKNLLLRKQFIDAVFFQVRSKVRDVYGKDFLDALTESYIEKNKESRRVAEELISFLPKNI